ncbi:hypothetical protein B9Z19DRAFT_1130178 [Tuber borchii]|uniref:Uncharacterized protein n=1 Tax=Tuber borchii TaxID=42251 RepID=A0A2T6ZL07_TUBBO|nr:hypothetical protein B9Z19DRAFT_1130178 [Tuber borchii]
MPSAYKWKPLPAGAHGHFVYPEMICRNRKRANLSRLETGFERYEEYQALDDDTKADMDREMVVEENEILEQESPPSPSSPSTLPLTLQVRGRSFSMHGAVGSPVSASVEPVVGLARAATFGTSRTREPISGRTRFKIRFGRRNPGTNRLEGTHTSLSMPTGGEDLREDELDEEGRPLIDWEDEEDQDVDFIDLYESDEEDGNGSEDSHEIYSEEMIYEEEEDKEDKEDDNSDNDNDNNYYDNGDRELSSHSLSRSENSDVEMIRAAAWEDAEEQRIDLDEIDRIDSEMDRQALLNLAQQQFPHPIKKKSEN